MLRAEYGVGTNVLNDMEWVAFSTNKIYTMLEHENATIKITLKCKTGPKNLRFKPAFFINFAEDDFPEMKNIESMYLVTNVSKW